MKIISEIFKKNLKWAALVFAVLILLLILSPGKRSGHDSKKYLLLKGQFEAYKTAAEKENKELQELGASVEKRNVDLRAEIDELEISKGEILAESADINKELAQKQLEIEDLQEKESGIIKLEDLVLNLRSQISTLQDSFSLAIRDRDAAIAALGESEKQVLKLEKIIIGKDEMNAQLNVALAAEFVARKASEAVISTGEKRTLFYKAGKLAGDLFKLYGIFSAGKDIVKLASK